MSKIKALINPVTLFQQNAPIVFCDETKKCSFVDPGGDIEILLDVAKNYDLIPEQILLTHGHIDHAGGAQELSEILKIKIIGPHINDKFLLDELESYGSMLGVKARNCSPHEWLDDGKIINIGLASFKVYFCPGHTPGHIIFFNQANNLALVGDVLFKGSIGRTDLPGGNHEQLIESITNKLWPLGKDIKFIPGHGPISTFKEEMETNPFVGNNVFR